MKYEIIINSAGEIHRIYRHAKNPDRAIILARIEVAKRTGHLPDLLGQNNGV
ncbi:MAG: hypothetical protein JRD89_18360 [Deltaproteobacteria bacterium]|nr:hypothetical protein [Deltaproteobacteria bacterium]